MPIEPGGGCDCPPHGNSCECGDIQEKLDKIAADIRLEIDARQSSINNEIQQNLTSYLQRELSELNIEIDYDLIASKILAMIAEDDRFQQSELTTQQLLVLLNAIPEEDLAQWAKDKLPGIQPQWVAPDGTVLRTGKIVKLGQRMKMINRDTFSKE